MNPLSEFARKVPCGPEESSLRDLHKTPPKDLNNIPFWCKDDCVEDRHLQKECLVTLLEPITVSRGSNATTHETCFSRSSSSSNTTGFLTSARKVDKQVSDRPFPLEERSTKFVWKSKTIEDAFYGNKDACKELLASEENIDELRDPQGKPLLMVLSMQGKVELVDLLLSAGVDVFVTNEENENSYDAVYEMLSHYPFPRHTKQLTRVLSSLSYYMASYQISPGLRDKIKKRFKSGSL